MSPLQIILFSVVLSTFVTFLAGYFVIVFLRNYFTRALYRLSYLESRHEDQVDTIEKLTDSCLPLAGEWQGINQRVNALEDGAKQEEEQRPLYPVHDKSST